MNLKVLLAASLFVLTSQKGIAQISIDSLNNYLTGKWNWVRCSGGFAGQGCSQPGPSYSTYFFKLPGDSLAIEVYNGSNLVNSGATIAEYGSTIFGSAWQIPVLPVDPVLGTPRFPPLFITAYPVLIDDANNVGFADNFFDGFTYHYQRDLTTSPIRSAGALPPPIIPIPIPQHIYDLYFPR